MSRNFCGEGHRSTDCSGEMAEVNYKENGRNNNPIATHTIPIQLESPELLVEALECEESRGHFKGTSTTK